MESVEVGDLGAQVFQLHLQLVHAVDDRVEEGQFLGDAMQTILHRLQQTEIQRKKVIDQSKLQ